MSRREQDDHLDAYGHLSVILQVFEGIVVFVIVVGACSPLLAVRGVWSLDGISKRGHSRVKWTL